MVHRLYDQTQKMEYSNLKDLFLQLPTPHAKVSFLGVSAL